MITRPASHDYTLVDQLNSVTVTQPVGTHTNERSIENKICNIKTKVSHLIGNIPHSSYKRLKAAVKYTDEKIDAHPRIAISMFILSTVAGLALALYNHTLCKNSEESHPIIALSALIVILITAVIALALTSHSYKVFTYREASLPKIVADRLMAAVVYTYIVAMVAVTAYATFVSLRYTHCA